MLNASHAARCTAWQGVRSHPVPVAPVGECSIPQPGLLTSEPDGSFRPRGSGRDLFDGLREGRDASPSRGLALSQLLTIRLSALYQPALKPLTRPVTQYR